jgi:hypothetical protein
MNQDKNQAVEKLLAQMPLQQPSNELNDAVFEMLRQQGRLEIVPARSARFGWRSLVATALACVLVGVFIGKTISKDNNSESRVVTGGEAPQGPVLRPRSRDCSNLTCFTDSRTNYSSIASSWPHW